MQFSRGRHGNHPARMTASVHAFGVDSACHREVRVIASLVQRRANRYSSSNGFRRLASAIPRVRVRNPATTEAADRSWGTSEVIGLRFQYSSGSRMLSSFVQSPPTVRVSVSLRPETFPFATADLTAIAPAVRTEILRIGNSKVDTKLHSMGIGSRLLEAAWTIPLFRNLNCDS
jgi:hypothetical protein